MAEASGISVNVFISDDIESVNDILFLLIKFERQAHLSINGNKDGKTGADSADMPTPKAETMHEKIQRYQAKADRQNAN